ncbi:uncharacterized protein LOC119685570 isoform X2 [Teleopsis dalmanni]|uniref:uncharacterized protein LOC119685570 isoform X2 n=1 Tax=Teleopsis dalmanni TaxID=139649 RepID=UPI0018CDBA6C|nr:uncharacterized protein LOC119685570 isoform X2 [Teleopsis dalmanni]
MVGVGPIIFICIVLLAFLFFIYQTTRVIIYYYKLWAFSREVANDRQGNIFTISEGSENNAANRYADFFYLEPNSEEAARIRAQLEKDDKELPSYDDVMRINNITTPTASGAPIGASTTSIATTDTTLTVPPYSEVDPHPPPALPTQTDRDVTAILPNTTTIGTNTQFTCDITNIEPSTSRAAAAAASTSTAITIPIDNPVTNSNV